MLLRTLLCSPLLRIDCWRDLKLVESHRLYTKELDGLAVGNIGVVHSLVLDWQGKCLCYVPEFSQTLDIDMDIVFLVFAEKYFLH